MQPWRADAVEPASSRGGEVASEWHDADATINVLLHPREELSLLGDLKAEGASVGWAGITVVGAKALST